MEHITRGITVPLKAGFEVVGRTAGKVGAGGMVEGGSAIIVGGIVGKAVEGIVGSGVVTLVISSELVTTMGEG